MSTARRRPAFIGNASDSEGLPVPNDTNPTDTEPARQRSTGRLYANPGGEVLEWRDYRPVWTACYEFPNGRRMYIWSNALGTYVGSPNGRRTDSEFVAPAGPGSTAASSLRSGGELHYRLVTSKFTPDEYREAFEMLVAANELMGH